VNKDIGSFVVSVLLAPIIGIAMSAYLLFQVAQADLTISFDDYARACAAEHLPICGVIAEFRLLQRLSFGALAATILLPLGYTLVLLSLANNRAALARGFPLLVRVCLALLPLVLASHAVLIAFVSFEALVHEMVRPNMFIVLAVLAVIGALLLAAFNILTDMRRLLAIEPVRVTGIAIDEARMPDLFSRVRRIAQKLSATPPRHIAIGVEPMVFMTSIPVRLRGIGDLPEGETLYLSTLALRTLDETELDGLLAYELAHFRGSDLAFSQRFAPAQAALVNAVESVDEDSDESVFMKVAKAPAYGLLSLMLFVLRWRMKKVIVEREAAADHAALAFAPAPKMIPMIIKMTALGSQWPEFRAGLATLMNRGEGRRNIAKDYLRRIADHLGKSDPGKLRFELSAMITPHPLDTHLSLGARAAAIGIDEKSLIAAVIAALRAEPAPNPALAALEETVTTTDQDYTRVPGHPIAISDSLELPPELSPA
jgi:Zn-dependent protease with chaperone function